MPALDDEPDDATLADIGRVTWRAILLEGLVDAVCASVQSATPGEDTRGIGRKIDDARKVLKRWTDLGGGRTSEGGDVADAWLVRAKSALDARNSLLHATVIRRMAGPNDPMPMDVMLLLEPFLKDEPTAFSLGVMPRGMPYVDIEMKPGALENEAALLAKATEGWRDVMLALRRPYGGKG